MNKEESELRFAQQFLFSTVRIETSNDSGTGAGTGFFYSINVSDKSFACIVTNKHVVEGAKKGKFIFTKQVEGKPEMGSSVDFVLGDFEHHWHKHPDPNVDLACTMLNPIKMRLKDEGNEPYLRVIDETILPTDDEWSELDAAEEIIFIGYPNGMIDRINLTPIVRRGITATPPSLDYEGAPNFLIDASVFPGSSGSPVFLFNIGNYVKNYQIVQGIRMKFLGVVSRVFTSPEIGQVTQTLIPTSTSEFFKINQMIDLGVVIKSKLVNSMMHEYKNEILKSAGA